MKQFYFSFVFLLFLSMGASAQVVISQVYGGGGNNGATLKNDFIELHNIGTSTINVSGWSVQYASSTGTSWQRTNLSGSIAPGQYYLVQQAQGSGGTVNLPTPDAVGTIPMAAGSGKVALVNNQTTLTGSCPTGSHIIDFVGFGTANCSETASTATLSNTTAAIRKTNGCTETNNNSSDFEVGTPAPRNSSVVYTCASVPLQVSVLAGNDASETGFNGSFEFTLSVPAPSGGVSLTYNLLGTATSAIDYTDVSSGAVLIPAGSSSASINLNALEDNLSEGTETITINLLTVNNGYTINGGSANISLFDNEGQLNFSYALNNCVSFISEGFIEYSITGAQKWTCTTFGRSSRGVNMSGFSGGASFNEDWLISPSFDLTATAYPLLSFWSRAEFSGPSLQLKISTDYLGYGDPNNATWTDLNGHFPEVGTNTWTLSENISLSAYKQSSVYIAWVYTSNDEEAARWTLDDIMLDNSLVPAPPTLTVNAELLNFNYAAYGNTATKSFTFMGTDLTGPVSLSVTGPFSISKDGITYSSSVEYSLAEANNVLQTVYVRFAPTGVNSNYSGAITINTASLTETVNLKGSSMDPASTLDVVNWNIEWFGSASLGPSNDNLQEQNVVNVMNSLDADLYALGEIVSEPRLQSVVSQLPNYAYVIGNYGSGATTPTGIASAQKLAFVYNTSVFSNVSVRPMINAASGTTSYTNWSSGRYPFLMTADVTVNCVTKSVSFILIHAKANTSPLITSYNRRKAAAEELKDTIDTHFNDDHVIILGDFNDDLDETITAGVNPPRSSYVAFTMDQQDFFAPTLSLSLQGEQSTVTYDNVIDHVIITNEVVPYYVTGSASILTDVSSTISNYGNTTSDHYPVLTRYQFESPFTVTIPDAYALPSGVLANTVYIGYAPASSITMTTSVAGGEAPYTYSWTPGTATTSSYTVSPLVETNYAVSVTDANGCIGYASKTIEVMDIRGGHKLDKVIICHKGNTQVVDGNAVSAHLKHGDMLGGCSVQAVTQTNDVHEAVINAFALKAYPNPSSNAFRIVIERQDPLHPVSLRVFDLQGRLVESISRVNSVIDLGAGY